MTDAVASFLFREAQLLDGRQWEAWLDLWDPEGTYWIPCGPPDYDPLDRVSLLYESYAGLKIRVDRLSGTHAYSQDPPAEVLHMVSNVTTAHDQDDGVVTARSNLLLLHVRRGVSEVSGGQVMHELVPDRSAGFRIRHKRICLLGSEGVLGNLTFLF